MSSTIFGVQTSYNLGFHWLLTLFLRRLARCSGWVQGGLGSAPTYFATIFSAPFLFLEMCLPLSFFEHKAYLCIDSHIFGRKAWIFNSWYICHKNYTNKYTYIFTKHYQFWGYFLHTLQIPLLVLAYLLNIAYKILSKEIYFTKCNHKLKNLIST